MCLLSSYYVLGTALRNGGKETPWYRGYDGRPREVGRMGNAPHGGCSGPAAGGGVGGYGGEDEAGGRCLKANRSLCELASVGSDRERPEVAPKSGAQKGAG